VRFYPGPRCRALFILSVAIEFASCASLRASNTPEDDSDAVTLAVVNHHQLNVVVYNVAQGHRDRIGEVIAVSSASFKLHLRHMSGGEIRLYADPIGSSLSATSEILHPSAGDTVTWTLETDLARSHVEIR